MMFKKWFDDMQERYQAYYGGYEGLLQEAFEAGANQEREACATMSDWILKEGGGTWGDAIRKREQI
jgi:hypothetical protein